MKSTTVPLQGVEWQFLSPEGRIFLTEMAGEKFSGDVIKDIPKRRVVRGHGVYVKEVRYRGWAVLFKTLFGGTACREGRISLALSESGIAVPEILAFGVEKKKVFICRDLLITREVPKGKSLIEVMRQDYQMFPTREKWRLAEEFATFIKSLHDVGVSHADLHIGNILCVPESDRGHSFILLDTDRITMKNRPLSRRERTDSLVLLFTNFWFLVSRSQRFRFLRYYGIIPGKAGWHIVKELAVKGLRHLNRTCYWKAHRCLSNNSRFGKKKTNGFTVYYQKTDDIGELLKVLLPNPDILLNAGQVFKTGLTIQAARIEICGESYFLKRFNCKGWKYRLKNTLRRSRAVRSWLVSWEFRYRGLPVPEPLICLEERRMGLLGRSYLLFQFIEKSETLSTIWSRSDPVSRRDLLGRVALLLGRMHLLGGLHGDLKWNNILVGGKGGKGLYLTDLDGTRIVGQGKLAVKRKDLKRFLVDMEKNQAADNDKAFFLRCWGRWSS